MVDEIEELEDAAEEAQVSPPPKQTDAAKEIADEIDADFVKSIKSIIGTGVYNVLNQYTCRKTLDAKIIKAQVDTFLFNMWQEDHINGYSPCSIEITDHAITAQLEYQKDRGGMYKESNHLVFRMDKDKRAELLAKINALSDELEQDKLCHNFERAMKGI